MAVADKVKSIIVEQLGVDEEEVTPDASFVDDLGADSLDTVELVMFQQLAAGNIADLKAARRGSSLGPTSWTWRATRCTRWLP